jgi:hypothetical protein
MRILHAAPGSIALQVRSSYAKLEVWHAADRDAGKNDMTSVMPLARQRVLGRLI